MSLDPNGPLAWAAIAKMKGVIDGEPLRAIANFFMNLHVNPPSSRIKWMQDSLGLLRFKGELLSFDIKPFDADYLKEHGYRKAVGGSICSFTCKMRKDSDYHFTSVSFLSGTMEELEKKASKMTARDMKYAPNAYPPNDSMVWAAITLMDAVMSDNIYPHAEDLTPEMTEERLNLVKSSMLKGFEDGLIEMAEIVKGEQDNSLGVAIALFPEFGKPQIEFKYAMFESGTVSQVKEIAKQYRVYKKLSSSKAIKPGASTKSLATRKDVL